MTNNLEQRFWNRALGAPLVILTDFDYTISVVDVGDLICDTLAPYPRPLLARYARGEAGTRELWLASFAHVDRDEAVALADQVAIDPGFHAFVAWAEREGIPLAVVSDGFTLYIDRILGREGLGHLPVFANRYVERGRLEWPNANPACDLCGCCKAAVVRRLKEVRRPGGLHRRRVQRRLRRQLRRLGLCQEQPGPVPGAARLAVLPVHRLRRRPGRAAAAPARFRDGTMERRSTLRPHARCRF